MEGTSSAVLKALTILDYLGSCREGQRLKDLAEAVGLPESTAHRLLNSLAAKGYVQQNLIDQTYTVGWQIVNLARAVNREVHLVRSLHPFLERLAEQSKYSANLAVLQQNKVMYLDCVVPAQSVIAIYSAPGTLLPAHATALGKVLLAHLPADEAEIALERLDLVRHTPGTITDRDALRAELERVRRQGYAVDDGEFVPDIHCVAAPVRDAGGKVVAAMSVSARAVEFPPEKRDEAVSILLGISRAATQALQDRGQSG